MVHPHARGEHFHPERIAKEPIGSSPRPWGTHVSSRLVQKVLRFIPTPVGNTQAAAKRLNSASVHPHARGEHTMERVKGRTISGSSPRPWGTLDTDGLGFLDARFIPTPVGNTAATSSIKDKLTVHPHARGEHPRLRSPCSDKGGSSPRPWGTLPPRGGAGCRDRFIPTPVGNTAVFGPPEMPAAVHPHARGEHKVILLGVVRGTGSSPRPWGTPAQSQGPRKGSRFIPTPVGNTGTR